MTPGTVVADRYRVMRLLGEGAMKAVYLVEDLRFKTRRCALAVMVDSFTTDDARREAVLKFEREADVLSQLDHPSIPKVSDRFSEQNRHYFVMEYVPGETLEAKLKAAGGRLDQSEVVDLALQICVALNYLHTRTPPVVYRDLKPSNVMVTPEGQVKLIDFGIARHFIRQGTRVGTIGYAAPEQYQGESEPRSDVYSLGATLHHLLSGRDPTRFPFDFPPLSTLAPGCNPELDTLISEALRRERTERVPSAMEFARRLRLIKPGVPLSSPESATFPPSTGMRHCPRCARQIPADANLCPSCGEALVITRPSAEWSSTPATPPPSPTARFCPNCHQEIPIDARLCPYCTQASQADPSQAVQGLAAIRGRVTAVLAIVLIALLVGGGLYARSTWGPAEGMTWPVWILAGLALLVVEVHYTRDFTIFCFGVSALVVGITAAFGVLDVWAQWVGFGALSTALLFWAREWLRVMMLGKPGDVEFENVVGQIATPLDDMPAYGFGKAELRGTTWRAHNASSVNIRHGQRCKVMKVNGLTLWIMPE